MEKAVLAFHRVEMCAGLLETCGAVRTIADGVKMNAMPAGCQTCRIKTHHDARRASSNKHDADRGALRIDEIGAHARPALGRKLTERSCAVLG